MNFQDIVQKISNPNLLEKTQNHVNKLEFLLSKLNKQYRFHLPSSDNSISEFNLNFFKTFKQMSNLLYLVLLELLQTLDDLGLYFYESPLLSLFQFFKFSSIVFMKGNVSFYQRLISKSEKDILVEEK